MLAYEKELRKDYTKEALKRLEDRAVKFALMKVASELGIDTLTLLKYKYEKGYLMHLVCTGIREILTERDLLRKKIKKLQKQREDDFQTLINFVKGEEKANEKKN